MSELTLQHRSRSGFSLLSALVAGQFVPGKLWRSPSWRVKFLLRSLLTPVSSLRHMQHISHEPAMQQVLPYQPTLPGKIHRQWLHLGLSVAERAAGLHYHYHFVAQRACPSLRTALLAPALQTLATFSGKEGETLTVSLSNSGRCEREGEANLYLNCDGITLAVLTFAITERDGQPQLTVGGLQGAHRDTPHDLIRQTTKSCYGLFPKRLLLEAAILLARRLGIQQIYAVRDAGHVFNCLRYRIKKRDLFHASYDEFWQTVGATPVSRYLYQLPLCFAQKPLEEIASKKRAEYRRRYALLETLHQQFQGVQGSE